MQYGHFDQEKKEYVIDRVDLPTSWTNYLGVKDTCVVVNQTAGGYMFYKSPEYHRVTRFRGNSVPMDRPGHYVYLRDNETKDYWSVSWQPVGKPLDEAKYTCRHGMSYSVYECDYQKLKATQTLVVPIDEDVELWDVTVTNNDSKPRNISLFTYCEFSFHHIMIDNQNFQMSLYCAGSSYEDGITLHDLFYEEFGYQYFTSTQTPDGYDCLRDKFLGLYHTESDPIGVINGELSGSTELGNNHCGSLQHNFVIQPNETIRIVYMLGEGNHNAGKRIREKYSNLSAVDQVYHDLKTFWSEKQSKLQIQTPNEGMNTLINTWTLYQAEINVMFSRFASFIEVGGRTGLGYRDTAQDSMTIPHSNPEKCKQRIRELMQGLVSEGYGLHLFQPEWFAKDEDKKPFKSPTVVPSPDKNSIVHGIKDACSDDALWLVSSVVEYIKETGEFELADEVITYADGGEGTVYEHLTKILDFSAKQVGATGICKGLRADWNDCLNLGGGESAMVSFLHYWALNNFISLAKFLNREEDVQKYTALADHVKEVCNKELWDQEWFIRGITKNGKKIGTINDKEGKIHLESNSWAVLSGAATEEKGLKAMDSVYEHLYTPYGILLNAPSYTVPDDDIGFVTRVYPGLKENGAIFSHPNPWAWAAECELGRGDRAMEFYNALCPYYQNDKIEIREAEPYSYCQFIMGRDHTAFGRARHPFMTGTGGWAYFSATRYMLGIKPQFDYLEINPCIPGSWDSFQVTREWRGAVYEIAVENPDGVMKGVKEIYLDGKLVERLPVQEPHTTHHVRIVMGV
ncbi:GH36-type glycosyl hydrolase domain-containing protein [Lachnoclostridium phytofermentans]|uniref:Glycosyltransferase 36 n=1 Tax=Lachnoclostridium phytofermentans (strain ATCC 700394 / DSM 18823 / ISDg) TaxID=357809 RepID=A9KL52_LACP7|nr:N,N'-diacetylchitobiose phosphorylase [Lachnoclostridium phytofermentans]ABX44201.1 glycosyltransferase 36 [Lachnoclostridium phytofermentans ISDg]